MSSAPLAFPEELRVVPRATLENYVQARVRQFTCLFAGHLHPNASDEAVQTAFAATQTALNQNREAEGFSVRFRHKCRYLGCPSKECVLCQNNPHKHCGDDDNFDEAFADNQILKSKCEADIWVELWNQDSGMAESLPDTELQVSVIDGDSYSATNPGRTIRELLKADEGHGLLGTFSTGYRPDSQGRLNIKLQEGQARLPDVCITDKNDTFHVNGGTFSSFRLMARCVKRNLFGVVEVLPNVQPAVSQKIIVKTQRALNDYRKSEYPHHNDELTKLKYIGSITAQRLREVQVHLGPDVPFTCIETVEHMKQLMQYADSNNKVQGKLLELLNMKGKHKHKWEYLHDVLEHKVVYNDMVPRVWYADELASQGVLFSCRQAQVNLDKPVGLVQRVDLMATPVAAGAGAPTGKLMVSTLLEPAQVEKLRQWRGQAEVAWYTPNHQGWALVHEALEMVPNAGGTTQSVLEAVEESQSDGKPASQSGGRRTSSMHSPQPARNRRTSSFPNATQQAAAAQQQSHAPGTATRSGMSNDAKAVAAAAAQLQAAAVNAQAQGLDPLLVSAMHAAAAAVSSTRNLPGAQALVDQMQMDTVLQQQQQQGPMPPSITWPSRAGAKAGAAAMSTGNNSGGNTNSGGNVNQQDRLLAFAANMAQHSLSGPEHDAHMTDAFRQHSMPTISGTGPRYNPDSQFGQGPPAHSQHSAGNQPGPHSLPLRPKVETGIIADGPTHSQRYRRMSADNPKGPYSFGTVASEMPGRGTGEGSHGNVDPNVQLLDPGLNKRNRGSLPGELYGKHTDQPWLQQQDMQVQHQQQQMLQMQQQQQQQQLYGNSVDEQLAGPTAEVRRAQYYHQESRGRHIPRSRLGADQEVLYFSDLYHPDAELDAYLASNLPAIGELPSMQGSERFAGHHMLASAGPAAGGDRGDLIPGLSTMFGSIGSGGSVGNSNLGPNGGGGHNNNSNPASHNNSGNVLPNPSRMGNPQVAGMSNGVLDLGTGSAWGGNGVSALNPDRLTGALQEGLNLGTGDRSLMGSHRAEMGSFGRHAAEMALGIAGGGGGSFGRLIGAGALAAAGATGALANGGSSFGRLVGTGGGSSGHNSFGRMNAELGSLLGLPSNDGQPMLLSGGTSLQGQVGGGSGGPAMPDGSGTALRAAAAQLQQHAAGHGNGGGGSDDGENSSGASRAYMNRNLTRVLKRSESDSFKRMIEPLVFTSPDADGQVGQADYDLMTQLQLVSGATGRGIAGGKSDMPHGGAGPEAME